MKQHELSKSDINRKYLETNNKENNRIYNDDDDFHDQSVCIDVKVVSNLHPHFQLLHKGEIGYFQCTEASHSNSIHPSKTPKFLVSSLQTPKLSKH